MGSIQIKTGQISDNSISSAKILANAITSVKIQDAAISSSKLGSGAVSSAAIASGALNNASMFGSNVIATAALQSSCITADKVGAGEIGTSALANVSVTEGKLANGSVSSSKLGAGSVLTAALGDLQVTSGKLAGSIPASKLNLGDTFAFTGTATIGTPSSGTDIANKSYVDGVASGLAIKENVRVAVDSNIDLSDLPASVDGVALSNGDRFLAFGQTTGSQNGVYVYSSSGGSASRASDMSSGDDFKGAFLFSLEGTFSEQGFVCSTDGTINVGVTSIAFQRFTGLGSVSVNNGLEKNGDTIGILAGGVGTTQLADGSVNNAKLGSACVQTSNVGDAQITQAKLANDSVGAAQVIDGSIDTVALANSAITEVKLSDNSVSSSKIVDSSITSGKLATAAVQTAAIGDAQVVSAKIANDAISSQHIADSAINNAAMFSGGVVDANALASSSVVSSKIQAGAVGTSALAGACVDSSKLADSSVTSAKLGITFAQEGFQISGSSTNSVTIGQSLTTNEAKAVLVFKNGLSLRNATALGDSPADNDEFSVSGNTVTFGANLENADGLMVWYFS